MLDHGIPYALTDRVRRIVAPNPGVMTGPGTNTYLLGRENVAVLDPGPNIDAHVDAILEAAGDRIRWVVCTHTHPDHSPAWRKIVDQTGAQTLGGPVITDQFQDTTFKPQRLLSHDDVLATEEFTLRAVYTPGHVGNHFCYFLEQDGIMFAGDHIMNGSTVVIIPPSGDMKLYIESLRRMLDYPLESIAPGHGELMTSPQEAVEWLINHRMKRESKVVAGLQQLGRSDLDELVKFVYDDVDTSLHKMAKLSMTAHLIKLREESRVMQHEGGEDWELLV